MSKLKKEIKSMLGNIVGEELGKEIFEANFPEPIINYKAGNILTFKQIKELPEDTVIHILYYDEDDNLREDGFQKLSKDEDGEEWSAGAFPFPTKRLKDDELIDRCDNSDWTFTIREAIKVSAAEFKKLEKQREKKERALELLEKMQDGEKLLKEEKKELQKITGIRIG